MEILCDNFVPNLLPEMMQLFTVGGILALVLWNKYPPIKFEVRAEFLVTECQVMQQIVRTRE